MSLQASEIKLANTGTTFQLVTTHLFESFITQVQTGGLPLVLKMDPSVT